MTRAEILAMTPAEIATREELKKELIQTCNEIGCSRLNDRCPGNPLCGILLNIVFGGRSWTTVENEIRKDITP